MTPGEHREHALIAGSNLQLDRAHSVFQWVEYVHTSADELASGDGFTGQVFDVPSLAVGYIRVRGSVNLLPGAIEVVYGSRAPVGLAIFLGLRPALLKGQRAMDPQIH